MSHQGVKLNFMAKDLISLPSRNRYSSYKEWEVVCWQEILKSGGNLESLVTDNERHNIVVRAAVMNLINSGKKFRQIGRELQISLQTVNSIKKAFLGNGYKSYRERGKTERKKKVFNQNSSRKKKEPYRPYRRTKYRKVHIPINHWAT